MTPSVRIHPYGAYLIVYVVEQSRDVLIVRVGHGHEEWQEQPVCGCLCPNTSNQWCLFL
ncbi:type II toxin-antitoxin system RelE/ParE family toxin [Thermodesulfobacteriota bacterium]